KIMRHGVDENGINVPVAADSVTDAIDMDPDGFVRFSIATTFERAANTYPKLSVGVFLRLRISGDSAEIQLLNKKYIPFTLELDNPETWRGLFAGMVEL